MDSAAHSQDGGPPPDGGGIRPITIWLPICVFVPALAFSFLRPDAFLAAAVAANDWILASFGSAFALAAFAFVLLCAWVAVSPLGRARIGGEAARPLLARWNWYAITLNTTIAIGILFWATAEPIYHLGNPGGLAVEPGGEGARRFAMASLFMHWAFTPYAIYTVTALAFALVHYNMGGPFSLASPIAVLAGRRRLPCWLEQTVDAVALASLLFGLTASLGAGLLSISGGLARLTALQGGPVLLALIALAVVLTFLASSLSGLDRGIRLLSDINTRAFIALLLFVGLAGPTGDLFAMGLTGIADYAVEFVPRSLLIAPYDDRQWVNGWTVFYFANWMAWAPVTAMFLGRIARGYRVREFLVANLLLPSLFAIVWMSVFGGFALSVAKAAPGRLEAVLDSGGPEAVLYAVVDALPFAPFVAAALIATSFLSYVTAADSNTDVLARISVSGPDGTEERPGGEHEPGARGQALKVVWAALVGLSAWVMVTFAGIDGVKMLSNLGGLPALFLISAFAVTLALLSVRTEWLRA